MSRAWSLHVPSSQSSDVLVVMLHGCVQPASHLVVGTRMNDAAGERGWSVLWPEQSLSAHPLRCWNWYLPDHQRREGGEPALLAELIQHVSAKHGFTRAFVCGISAGAAMAATLAACWPELFAAAAYHSGVAFGAADSAARGLEVMRDADVDPVTLGRAAHAAMGTRARVMPTLVLHGGQDQALNPANGTRLAQQWAVANRLALGHDAAVPAAAESVHGEEGRYDATVARYEAAAVEEWRIGPLGHAWSGGSPDVTYTDPKGPDATGAVVDFFARAIS